MKQKMAKIIFAAVLLVFSCGLISFLRIDRMTEDFLQQLGINKVDADMKIVGGFLYGSLDQYGLKNAKNITLGNRAAVTGSLLMYVKKQVTSAAFMKEYENMRQQEKPGVYTPQTPEELHQEMIDQVKKSVADVELSVKKAEASMKTLFEKMLVDLKHQQKLVEDPNNKQIASYRNNYPQLLKDAAVGNQQLLEAWEQKYPANYLLFVKTRLQQFMEETKDIDFEAELIEKNGVKYFVNKAYEGRGNRWKMAYRAGKPVVETARRFAEQWMSEIR